MPENKDYHLRSEKDIQDRTAEIIESRNMLQAMMDAPNVGVGVFKAIRNNNGEITDFKFDFVNKRTIEAFRGNDPTGTRLTDYGNDGTEQLQYFKEAIETGKRNSYTKKAAFGIVEGWFLFSNAPLGNDRLIQVWEDITDLKNAEQQIQESKELLQTAINTSITSFDICRAVRDENNTITDFEFLISNNKFQPAGADLVGKKYSEVFPGIKAEGIFDKFIATTEKGIPQDFEIHYSHEGFDNWYRLVVVKLGDGFLNTGEDITERKKAEQVVRDRTAELQASKELLQATIDSTLDVIQVFETVRDENRKIIDFTWVMNNKKGIEQNGDVTGKSLLQKNPGVIATGIFDKMVRVVETGVPIEHEQHYQYEQFNGWFYQELVRSGDGVVMTTRDITRQKKADQEILRLKDEVAKKVTDKYSSLFNSIDQGFCIIELLYDENEKAVDYRWLEANSKYERHSGIKNPAGKLGSEIIPSTENYWLENYDKVLKTGKASLFENWHEATGRWYQTYATRIGDNNSRQIAIVFDDITERKQRELSTALLSEIGKDLSLLNTAEEMMYAVGSRLTRFMQLTGCVLTDVNEERGEVTAHYGFTEGVALLEQTYVLNEYVTPEFQRACKAGEAFIVNNTQTDDRLNAEGYARLGIGALAVIPFLHKGEWTNYVGITSTEPRQWKEAEIKLLWEVAERLFSRLERVRAEVALRKSEEKYRTLFETMDQGYAELEIIRGPDGQAIDVRFFELNPQYERLIGIPVARAMGHTVLEIVPDLDPWWIQEYGRIVSSGRPGQIENEWAGRWYEAKLYPRGGEKVSVLYEDITVRKKAEMALRESEEGQTFLLKLSDTLRTVSDVDSIANMAVNLLASELRLDRCYIVARRQDGDLWDIGPGFHVASLPPMPPVLDQKDFPGSLRIITEETLVFNNTNELPTLTEMEKKGLQALGFGGLVMGILRKGEKNPSWAMVAASVEPRQWTSGEVALIQEVAERTWAAIERAKAERALHESEAKYRTLFESADEGFCLMELIPNKDGYIDNMVYLETNQSYARLTGAPDVVGKSTKEVLPNLEQQWWDVINRVYQTGLPERIENEAVDFSRWFSVHFSRVGQKDNKRLALVFDNITERKLQEQRKDFLLKFNDIISLIKDPDEICLQACRFLGEYLHADRILYCALEDQGTTAVMRGFHAPGVLDFSGRRKISDYSQGPFNEQKKGVVIVTDTKTETRLSEEERKNNLAAKIGAYIGVPLIKDGEVTIVLAVHQETSRKWTEAEIALSKEMAERIWSAIEKAKVEEALRESEEKYRTLFESIDDGFTIVEMLFDEQHQPVDYRFLEANPAFIRQTALQNAMGKTIKEVVPGHEQFWFDTYGAVAETGKPVRFEHYASQIAGGVWYEVYAFPFSPAGNNQVAILFSDITVRKLHQQQQDFLLKISDLRGLSDTTEMQTAVMKLLAEHLGVTRASFFAIGEDGDEFVQAAGYEASAVQLPPHMHISDYIGTNLLADSLAGRTIVVSDTEADTRFEEQRAAYRAINVRAWINVPLVKNGRLIASLGVQQPTPREWRIDEVRLLEDVGERLWTAVEKAKAEEALEESEERYRIALQSAAMAAWDWNVADDLINWNEQHYFLLGLQPSGIKKDLAYFLQFVHEYDKKRVEEALRFAVAESGKFEGEFRTRRADNDEVRWMNGYGRAVARQGQQATRMVGVMFDITERKLLEQQKDDFIGIASHELKTPVTSIKAYTEILEELLDESGDAISKDLVVKLDKQVDRFLDLIRMLLDVTRISEGQFLLNASRFDINELVAEHIEQQQHNTDKHNLLQSSDAPAMVTADKERIGEVLTNLISNAIKYSPKGGDITINTTHTPDGIQVSVKDQGVGIPEGIKDKVFERFYRVRNATFDTFPGLGLGLYITAAIIQQHHGKIWVESWHGEGSIFYFTLPASS